MNFTPKVDLTEEDVDRGLKLVVRDGIASEMMTTLTGGAFLVSLALMMGASNFQIGLIAALPTLANLFQLVAIWLVHTFANRRAITVISLTLSRLPLLVIAALPFLAPPEIGIALLIGLLFIQHFFGAIAGTSWSSWMKDLVPESILGEYFSNRGRKIMIVAVSLSLIAATALDYVEVNFTENVSLAYSVMFAFAGVVGLYGASLLARTPEPMIYPIKQNLFRLFARPIKERNFRNLLIFNSLWAFAVNLAAPFFTVYMLKMLGFPLSYVIAFTIISQISNIFFIRIWGRYSDKYSNKTVLRTAAPIYLAAILGWTFTTFPDKHLLTIPLLIVIHVLSGVALAGINLALSNIGYKLAPGKHEAIVFLSTRALVTAFFSGIAPVIGGLFADFFSRRQLNWNLEWDSPAGDRIIHTLSLQSWDFFFVTAFLFGIFSLSRLSIIQEKGESKRRVVMGELFTEMGREARSISNISGLKSLVLLPFSFFSLVAGRERRRKPRPQVSNPPRTP
ncbi:MAG TPA: MFS transporter [Gammaproteobacteria bacterium]